MLFCLWWGSIEKKKVFLSRADSCRKHLVLFFFFSRPLLGVPLYLRGDAYGLLLTYTDTGS